MLSTFFHRLPLLHRFSAISAWCITFAFGVAIWGSIMGTSLVQAAEFKPFLTLQLAGPHAIITIAEKIGAVVDPNGTLGMKNGLQAAAAFKSLPGVSQTGSIGLAIQGNTDSPFGLDIVVVLPLNDFNSFNIPGMEMQVAMLRSMFQPAGNNSLVFSSPVGPIVARQGSGYFIIATEGAAEFAATADPKKLFAELGTFTLGTHVNLDNLSKEAVEKVLGQIAMMMAMQGTEIDVDEILGNKDVMKIFDEFSSLTMGFTLDAKTLNLTAITQTVPKKGSNTAEKIQKVKNTKTKLGAFLHDTPKTVFSISMVDYLTDSDIKDVRTAWELITDGFIGGLQESIEEGEYEQSALMQSVDLLRDYIEEFIGFFEDERLLDTSFALDSDGILLMAMATKNAERILEMDKESYCTIVELFAGEEGKQFIDDTAKWNYETVAGYSLSCVPNLFGWLPEGTPIREVPVSLFWAVKKNEAIVYALSLDVAKAEQTVKAALQKTATAGQPKQTCVAGVKPLGELLLNKCYPILESGVGDKEFVEKVKKICTALSKADAAAKIVVTTEYPGESLLQKVAVDGKVFTAVLTPLLATGIQAGREAARRMQCVNNIKQIVLAFHNYHDAQNGFPVLYTVDADGKPLHSWRVLILPFIEQTELYDKIRLNEPWDSEYNKQFHNVVVPAYVCPDNTLCKPGKNCTYVVIGGSATSGQVFVPARETNNRPVNTFSAIPDGTSNTLAVVEVKEPFCWMDPAADITLDELAKGINAADGRCGSFHQGGCNVGIFDGSVRLAPATTSPEQLRAFGNPRDGVPVVW